MTSAPFYGDDLARIHDERYSRLAGCAAEVIVEALHDAGFHSGTVTDLGCGSGITALGVSDAGFDVLGVDLSGALVRRARERVPEGDFRVESFLMEEIPDSVAVTAVGEVLNYLADERNGRVAREDLFRRIHASLPHGGLFLFDAAGPDRAPPEGRAATSAEGPHWTLVLEEEADEARTLLTRRITAVLKEGTRERRSREVHRLELIRPEAIGKALRRTGFSVETLEGYGTRPFPKGLMGFLARK
jgi:SAM-dependent methyltransferase